MRSCNRLLVALLLCVAAPACSDDDSSGEGEGEGEGELIDVDVLVNAADGVLDPANSVTGHFFAAGTTSCTALVGGGFLPSQFEEMIDPVVVPWDRQTNPHVLARLPTGNVQIFVEVYASNDGTGEVYAAGCLDPVYVPPNQDTFHTSVMVTIRP